MRGLEARLQRLEQAAARFYPAADRRDSFSAGLDCLGPLEVRRLYEAIKAGDARLSDFESLVQRARARQSQGWTQAHRDALYEQDRDKGRALWEFMKTLGSLSNGCYLDTDRFDVLDVTGAEIMQLAEAAQTATRASDLEVVANIVGRLRLDGKVMDMATFEALVLRREITAAPRKSD
jgi:hypothetical protein